MSENVKVTCPNCHSEVWVRNHYNDPCTKCGHIIPAPNFK